MNSKDIIRRVHEIDEAKKARAEAAANRTRVEITEVFLKNYADEEGTGCLALFMATATTFLDWGKK